MLKCEFCIVQNSGMCIIIMWFDILPSPANIHWPSASEADCKSMWKVGLCGTGVDLSKILGGQTKILEGAEGGQKW